MNKTKSPEKLIVRDMFLYILKKWRAIVIAMLITGILFGGYSYYKSSKTAAVVNGGVVTSFDADKQASLQNAAAVISTYRTTYETQKDYNENSVYHRLDAMAINSVTLEYYVDNFYSVQYPNISSNNNLSAIVMAYSNIAQASDVYEAMAEQIGDPEKASNYYNCVLTNTDNSAAGYFTLTIYGYSEEVANKMADIVNDSIVEKTAELYNKFGDHTISLVSREFVIKTDFSVLDTQTANIARTKTLEDAIDDAKYGLSESELEYVEQIIASDESVETDEEQQTYSAGISKKYVVAGMLLGALVIAAYALFRYFFIRRVHTATDLEVNYGTEVVARLSLKESNKLDRKIEQLFGNETQAADFSDGLSMLSAKLTVIAGESNKKLAVFYDNIDKSLLDELSKTLESCFEIKLIDANKIDAEAINSISGACAVVVEKLEKSKYSNILNTKKLCNQCDVKVLGAIVLE